MKKLLICLTITALYVPTYTSDTSEKSNSILKNLFDHIKDISENRKDKSYDHDNAIDFYEVTQISPSDPTPQVDDSAVQQEIQDTNSSLDVQKISEIDDSNVTNQSDAILQTASPAQQEISEVNNSNTNDQTEENHTETPRKKSYLRYAPFSIAIATTVIVGIVYHYKAPIMDGIVTLKNKMASYFC